MELYAEVRAADMSDTFVAVVVGVHKQLLPAPWQCFRVNFKAMVLGRNVTFSRKTTSARDIMTTVAKLHLQSPRACRSRKKLVAQADAKNGRGAVVHGVSNISNSYGQHFRVSRSIGNEKSIMVFGGMGGNIVVPRYNKDLNTTR